MTVPILGKTPYATTLKQSVAEIFHNYINIAAKEGYSFIDKTKSVAELTVLYGNNPRLLTDTLELELLAQFEILNATTVDVDVRHSVSETIPNGYNVHIHVKVVKGGETVNLAEALEVRP